MKHHITKYGENGKQYAESWLQINLFGKCFCFWKKKIEISNGVALHVENFISDKEQGIDNLVAELAECTNKKRGLCHES